MLYCTSHKKRGETAGAKAPADIDRIARRYGAEELLFEAAVPHKKVWMTRLQGLMLGMKNWLRVLTKIEKDAWVILQHPNENILVANRMIDVCKKRKNARFIALIHDLDSIRQNLLYKDSDLSQRNSLADEVLLKKCDFLICHNDAMRAYLLEHGFAAEKIVTLGIFDYLHDCELPSARAKEKSVVVAGNLIRNKCEYLYKLMERESLDFQLELFGPNFSMQDVPAFIHYHGVCKPDELPGKLNGSFGLVWDGTEIDRCAGNAGEYIRYNNPHKCSLFLASNLPVIIWKEAALASFVEENGVGLAVESLEDIGCAIERLSDAEYAKMLENTKRIGEKLRSGAYFESALNAVFAGDAK